MYNVFKRKFKEVLPMSIVENILSLRERFTAKLQKANIFDNFFMRVVLENKEVCQYVLGKLLKKPDIIVLDCKTEVQISKLFGKDSRLDVLATDKTGKIFNIEIQHAKEDAHELRVRYYHSAVNRDRMGEGKEKKDLQHVYVIYDRNTKVWENSTDVDIVAKH